MQRAEYPVKVPTSTATAGATSWVSSVSRAPCSGATCIPETAPSAAVVAISSAATSSGGVP